MELGSTFPRRGGRRPEQIPPSLNLAQRLLCVPSLGSTLRSHRIHLAFDVDKQAFSQRGGGRLFSSRPTPC